jgi:cytoskeletal protein RodZ
MSRVLNREKGNVMLLRGLIAVSTLVFALSLAGCGEREQAKDDTEETVSTTVEKPAGEASKATPEVVAPAPATPAAAAPASSTTTTTTTTEAPATAPAATPEAAPEAAPAPAPGAPTQNSN